MSTRKHPDHSQPSDLEATERVAAAVSLLLLAGLGAVHLADKRLPRPIRRAVGEGAKLPGRALELLRHHSQRNPTRL